jgi:hypothetical protein
MAATMTATSVARKLVTRMKRRFNWGIAIDAWVAVAAAPWKGIKERRDRHASLGRRPA